MIGALRTPGVPLLDQLAGLIREELNRKEALLLGWRRSGSNVHVRIRSALSTPWVQVHVQSTQAGKGGADYDPVNFVSSTEVDCRASRVQDRTLTSLPDDIYYVFLIPVQYDGAGTKVLYDGQGGRPDLKSFWQVDAASASAADLSAHLADTSNPHAVTAAQLGFAVILQVEDGYLVSVDA